MPTNLIDDPGLELDDGSWTFSGDAVGEIQSGVVYAGSNSARLQLTVSSFTGVRVAVATSTDMVVTPGQEYPVKVYARCTEGNGDCRLRISHYPDGFAGAQVVIDDVRSTACEDAWVLFEFTITPNTAEDRIVFNSRWTGSPFTIFSAEWYIDEVSYTDTSVEEEVVATTKSIRDAMFADLNSYSSWTITPSTISKFPVDLDAAGKPCVFLWPGGGGEADLETVDNIYGGNIQQFGLICCVKSEDPIDDIDNLTDDVINAIERADGSLIALSYVTNVNVIEWGEIVPDVDLPAAKQIHRVLVVAVEYLHTRGSK